MLDKEQSPTINFILQKVYLHGAHRQHDLFRATDDLRDHLKMSGDVGKFWETLKNLGKKSEIGKRSLMKTMGNVRKYKNRRIIRKGNMRCTLVI